MTFRNYVREHPARFIVGGAILGLVAYTKVNSKYEPVIYGQVIQEVTIPKDIPERSQQTTLYWIDVETAGNSVIRLNFNTSDISYDTKNNKELSGSFVEVGRIGNFEGKALELEEKIHVGDRINVKVHERSGQERTVDDLVKLYR